MIKTFAINDQPFSLIPEPVLQNSRLNIFSADSMTLLVGPNGSGKTKLLLALAEAVATNNAKAAQLDWRDDVDARTTFALYFTPIPFNGKFLPNNKRFLAVQPARKRGKVSADVETAIDLAGAFGLDALPMLILSPYQRAVEFVKNLLFQPYRVNRPIYQFHDNWVAPLALLEAEQEQQESRLRKSFRDRGLGLTEMMADEQWRTLKQKNLTIRDEILFQIERHLGDEATLKIRAADLVRRSQPFTRDVRLELLSQLGLSITVGPAKEQRKAKDRFDDAVSRLRRIRNSLEVPSLRNNEFEISLEQWRAMSSLNTEGLAELSITRASSGSAALLDQFASLREAVDKISSNRNIRNLLLLIDEGDAFLHLEWQQKYIDFLDITVGKLWRERFDSIQIVLATHSPVLMSDFPKDCIHRLKKYSPNASDFIDSRQVVSFGAPLDTIIRSAGGAGTLGAFSTRIMRRLVSAVDKGLSIDEYYIDMIDDPIIKQHIRRIMNANDRAF